MKRSSMFWILGILIVLVGAVALTSASAQPFLGSGAPTIISYAGVVNESGSSYDGTGYLKFAVVDPSGTVSYWSNDGTSTGGGEPTAGIMRDISDGYFHVLLGDTSITNMVEITASVFDGTERYIRIWFSPDDITYTLLSPDTRIASVPYALQAQEAVDADTVDGLHASDLATHYQNVLIVAKSGGDFTSIQGAIDSIIDESSANPYLVWVAPGVYSETVTLKPYVHLQGAGQDVTIITSSVTNASYPPALATLACTSDTSIRDLTIENEGAGEHNVAFLHNAGSNMYVENATFRAKGVGTTNYAIFLWDYDTKLKNVTAESGNASGSNIGLYNSNWSEIIIEGGSFTASGGSNAYGIYSTDVVTKLTAFNTTAVGEYATESNYGLYNALESYATLQGGSFTGTGGNDAWGILNNFRLIAEGVSARGEDAATNNIGLESEGFFAYLRSGSYIGSGGTNAYGIIAGATELKGYNITSSAEFASGSNSGMELREEGRVDLFGGSITSDGGASSYGINITSEIGGVRTTGTYIIAQNGSTASYGLYNNGGYGAAFLVGGSVMASYGGDTYAFYNTGSSALIELMHLYVSGEFGSGVNYAIYNEGGALTYDTYCVIQGSTN